MVEGQRWWERIGYGSLLELAIRWAAIVMLTLVIVVVVRACT